MNSLVGEVERSSAVVVEDVSDAVLLQDDELLPLDIGKTRFGTITVFSETEVVLVVRALLVSPPTMEVVGCAAIFEMKSSKLKVKMSAVVAKWMTVD